MLLLFYSSVVLSTVVLGALCFDIVVEGLEKTELVGHYALISTRRTTPIYLSQLHELINLLHTFPTSFA